MTDDIFQSLLRQQAQSGNQRESGGILNVLPIKPPNTQGILQDTPGYTHSNVPTIIQSTKNCLMTKLSKDFGEMADKNRNLTAEQLFGSMSGLISSGQDTTTISAPLDTPITATMNTGYNGPDF